MILLLRNKINQTDINSKVIVNWSLTALMTDKMQVWMLGGGLRRKASQYIAFL